MLKKTAAIIVFILFIITATGLRAEKKPQFTFNWSIPCEFTLIETKIKKGNTVKTQFKIRVEKTKQAGIYKLVYQDVKTLKINGISADTDQMKRIIESQLGSQKALYANFLVDSKGNFKEVVNLEQKLAQYTEALLKVAKSPEEAQKILKTLDPEMLKSMITTGAKNKWMAWSEGWQNYPATVGEPVSAETQEKALGQIPMTFVATYSNLGPSKKYPGCVHLKTTGKPHQADVKKILSRFMPASAVEIEGKDARKMIEGMDFKIHMVQEVIIDPHSLKPVWMLNKKDMRIALPGKTPIEAFESQEYQFIWPKK